MPTHIKFLFLSFHRKNCPLWFVLTHLVLCFLWFVSAHTEILSLSFHRNKLSLLIFCGNTSFKFVNCDLCQHTSFLSLSFHRKKLCLLICANTSWTLLILICVNTHLIFPLFSAWLSLNVSASDALIYPFVFNRLSFSIYAYAGHCYIVE